MKGVLFYDKWIRNGYCGNLGGIYLSNMPPKSYLFFNISGGYFEQNRYEKLWTQ